MKDVAAFVVSISKWVKVVKMEDVAKLPEIGRNQVGSAMAEPKRIENQRQSPLCVGVAKLTFYEKS